MFVLLCCGLALGSGRARDAIDDARLLEAAHGDHSAAIAILESTLGLMDEADPARGELLYSLGRAKYWAGDVDGARDALAAALSSASVRSRAWSFLVRMEARSRRITSLPSFQGFDDDLGAWVRGWQRAESGSLERIDGGGPSGTVMGWTTMVREAEDDFLFMNFGDLDRLPRSIRMNLRARKFPAFVRLVLEDDDGQRWSGPVVQVGTENWTAIDVAVSSFAPIDDPKSGRRLSKSPPRTLMIQDLTALNGSDRGENLIVIDEVRIE